MDDRADGYREQRDVSVCDGHTVGCKSFPGFTGPYGEVPVNRYNRPYQTG